MPPRHRTRQRPSQFNNTAVPCRQRCCGTLITIRRQRLVLRLVGVLVRPPGRSATTPRVELQSETMKNFRFVVLAAVACLSTTASAQQHPDISGLWTRGGAAET